MIIDILLPLIKLTVFLNHLENQIGGNALKEKIYPVKNYITNYYVRDDYLEFIALNLFFSTVRASKLNIKNKACQRLN